MCQCGHDILREVALGPCGQLEAEARKPCPLTRNFLDTSVQHAHNEQRATRRRTRLLRQLVGLLTVLFVLAAATTGFAISAQRTATRERNQALSRHVAGEATALRATYPALAAQLALAAYRLSPTVEARGGLLSTFGTPYATRLSGHTNGAFVAVFSPDSRTLATTGADGNVRLWDVTDPHHPTGPVSLSGHTEVVTSAAFTPDGRTLATAGDDRTARLWDVSDPRKPRARTTLTGHTQGTLNGHTDVVTSVAVSPDGRTLGSASLDDTARLWDITDPRHPSLRATLTGHTNSINSVSIRPDGHTLATGSADHTARLRETDTERVVASICGITHPAAARAEWNEYFPGITFNPPCP